MKGRKTHDEVAAGFVGISVVGSGRGPVMKTSEEEPDTWLDNDEDVELGSEETTLDKDKIVFVDE